MAKKVGSVAKGAIEQLEEQLGESIITSDNRLDYKYKDKNRIESKN